MEVRELIKEFEDKALELKQRARSFSYSQANTKALYNTEAGTYERCAQRLREVLGESRDAG